MMVTYKCIVMTAYLKYDLLSNKAFAVCKEYPVVVIELITVWYQQGAGFYLKEKKSVTK